MEAFKDTGQQMLDFIEVPGQEPSTRTLKELAKSSGYSLSKVRKAVRKMAAEERIYTNGTYQVNVAPAPTPEGFPEMIHLSIKRLDKDWMHDWRELQQIKNMILSPEHEAVELYPAESRLVDVANQYHLWAFADPTHRFPFGLLGRQVATGTGDIEADNTRQRPL